MAPCAETQRDGPASIPGAPSPLHLMLRSLSSRAGTFACAALALSAFSLPSTAHAATAPAGFRPFAPDSIWNLPVRDDAPLASGSAAQVRWLTGQVQTAGTWINTRTCGMPTYWAAPGAATKTVRLDPSAYQDKALIRAWSAVPIPAGATPANCSDKNFAVIQPQPDGTYREWEFWKATQAADGSWTARWGGVTGDLQSDRGVASSRSWQDPTAPLLAQRASTFSWNVTASSISMMAGVITAADVARGHIDHALALATPDTAKGRFVWPAQRTDGTSVDPDALPEGAHLRLDPSLNLASIPMTPLVRMIAEAAQRYGIVVRDRTWSTTAFYTEEVKAGAADPFAALQAGKSASTALQAFPWSRLQVLAAPACGTGSGCHATQKAVVSTDGAAVAGAPVTVDTSNSWLDQPRARVEWDLDGNGTYERSSGTAVSTTFTPSAAGTRPVGVRITTLDGSVVTAQTSLRVAAAPATAAAPAAVAAPAAAATAAVAATASAAAATTASAASVAAAPVAARSAATVLPAAPAAQAKAPAKATAKQKATAKKKAKARKKAKQRTVSAARIRAQARGRAKAKAKARPGAQR
jgi:hypothetical protein